MEPSVIYLSLPLCEPVNRIYFAVMGALIGAGGLALAIVGDDGVVSATAIFIAGLLFVVGGLRERVRIGSMRLEWYRLIGGGIVLVGLGNVAFGLRGAIGSGVLSFEALVGALNLCLLLFVGIDFFRGGVHHDLSAIR